MSENLGSHIEANSLSELLAAMNELRISRTEYLPPYYATDFGRRRLPFNSMAPFLGIHASGHIVVSTAVAQELLADPKWHDLDLFDPCSRYTSVCRGYLGRLLQLEVFTDAYAHPDAQFMNGDQLEFVIVPKEHEVTL